MAALSVRGQSQAEEQEALFPVSLQVPSEDPSEEVEGSAWPPSGY